MKKVLIIGPNYFNFLPATGAAFARLGWETNILSYDNPVHPYTTWMKWRYKLSRHRDRLRQNSREAFQREAIGRFRSVRPDLVFLLNGDMLENTTLDLIRAEGARLALWLFDNRERLPLSASQAPHVDRLFCFERNDAEWFRQQGVDASFLPQACDPDIYKPLGVPKNIDILFVGNMWNSPRRKEMMLSVVRAFPDRHIEVYGLFQPWYKGVWRWLMRPYKAVFKNVNVPPEEVNKLYNRARVVLNIHQELQKDGANPRVFEISGSGSYQVCDGNDYIRSLFSPGSIGLYSTVPEMIALVRDGLETDTEARAMDAHRTVYAEHIFCNRIRTVLEAFPELG